MIRQCAWCMKILGVKAPLLKTEITHTICKVCQKKLSEQIKKEAS